MEYFVIMTSFDRFHRMIMVDIHQNINRCERGAISLSAFALMISSFLLSCLWFLMGQATVGTPITVADIILYLF